MPSGGHTLPKQTQTAMSARFGHDFSQVRVHTDSRSGDTAEALGANAFTLGQDIVFGAGRYAPGSTEGDRLLAHELTHVVQQDRWGGPGSAGPISHSGDVSEHEAESLADRVVSGKSVEVTSAPGAAIARQDGLFGDIAGAAASIAGPIGPSIAGIGDAVGGMLGPAGGISDVLGGLLGPAAGPTPAGAASPSAGAAAASQSEMGQNAETMNMISNMLQAQQGMEKSVINNMAP